MLLKWLLLHVVVDNRNVSPLIESVTFITLLYIGKKINYPINIIH